MTLPFSDPILVFSLIVGLILVLPILSKRLRLPESVLLLAAGALVGPHFFNLLARNSAITLFGNVGILYIMFLAGLEVDLHRFARVRNKSLVFGLITFAIPQTLGTVAGLYILHLDMLQSLLLASLFASHTLLAYPVASKWGLATSDSVVVTVGATLITDTLALLVLAVIADMSKGMTLDFWFWAGLVAGMGLLGGLARWAIPAAARFFFRRTQENGTAQFLFVLGVMSSTSWLASLVRLEPIIGAFLAGVAFNRLIPQKGTLMNRLEFFGNALFIPFFLLSVGMLVDLKGIYSHTESWVTIGVMVVAVVVTKWLAAHGSAKLFKYSFQEGQMMFGLSVVQAAATLAAVLVGYELKIFDERILNGAIAMIAVSGPLGSWVVEKSSRVLSRAQTGLSPASKPSEEHLLVSVANPASAPQLLELASALTPDKNPQPLNVVTIVPPQGPNTALTVAKGETLLATCVSQAAASELQIVPSVHIDQNVSDGLVRAALEHRATAMLMGWGHDRTVGSRLFGTVFEKILDDFPAGLFLARVVNPLNLTQRVVLPLPPLFETRTDGALVIEAAARLAKRLGASVQIFSGSETKTQGTNILKDLGARVQVRHQSFSDWTTLRKELILKTRPDDLVLLPVERRKGGAWFPSLDKLPELVAEKHPDLNLLAVYPPLLGGEELGPRPSLLSEEHLQIFPLVLPPGAAWESAMEHLASQSTFPHSEPVYSGLCQSAKSFPVELSPGNVLLHTHLPDLTHPILVVALAPPEGLSLPEQTNPVRKLFCLVSPEQLGPELHLANLSTLAKAFREEDFQARLDQTTDPHSFGALVHDALYKSFTKP